MGRRLRRVIEQLESRTLLAGTTFSFAAADHAAVETSWAAPGGGDLVVVTIVRGGDVSASGTQTVWLDTPEADGSAGVDDFQPVHMQPVTFTAGARAATVAINVLPDLAPESDETIALRLYGEEGPGAGVAPLSSSAVTIYDDDNGQPSTVRFAAAGFAGTEHPFFGPTTAVGLVRTGDASEFTTASLAVHALAAAPGVAPATAVADFLPGGTTVFFNPGDTVQWVPVPVATDGVPEGDEAVGLTLAPGNTIPAPGAGETRTYTILDVDGGTALPRVSVANVSVVEGNPGSPDSDLALTFTLSQPADQSLRFTVESVLPPGPVAPGLAEPFVDFRALSAYITFQPGETSQTFTFPGAIFGDGVAEVDETIIMRLSDPSPGLLIEDGFATVTILDDEPRLSVGDAQAVEESDFGQPWPEIRFPVTLRQPSDQPVGVWVRTVSGSGTAASSDYEPRTAFLTFDPGATRAAFVVPVAPDVETEDDETFTVELFDPQGATIADGNAVGTILEDDAPLVFVDDLDVREGSDGLQRTVDVTVRLARPVSQFFGVEVQLTPGTADANDFLPGQGFIEFQPGTASQTIPVLVNGDFEVEPDETFTVELSSPGFPFVRLGDDTATVTLRDDDRGGHFRLADTSPISVFEGGQTELIAISRDIVDQPATVRYTLVPGTAGLDDFGRFPGTGDAVTGVIEFAAGAGVAFLGNLLILDDELDEPDESFTIALSDPSDGASLQSGFESRAITVLDTDPTLPTLSVSDVAVVETAGGSFADFTVALNGPLWQGNPVLVNYMTVDGTATSAEDYEFRSGFIEFREGQSTTRTIRVPISDDNVYEPGAAEQFGLQLRNEDNARLPDPDGAATITDNDPMFGWFSFIPETASVAEDGGSVGVTLSFTPTVPAPGVIADRPQSLNVAWTTSGGEPGFDAAPGSDYEHAGGTVQFSGDIAGGAFIATSVLNDTTAEPDERFKFSLHEAAPAGTAYRSDVAPVTILDDDRGGVFRIDGFNVRTEGATATFTVSRSSGQEVAEVTVVTVDGTAAAAGGDYAASSQRLTFAAGETSKAVTVDTLADGANVELDEQFTVELRNPGANANLSTTHFSSGVTIRETYFNGLIRLVPESPGAGVVEGQAFAFRVERVGRADQGVGFSLERVSGTAFPFSDYDNPPFVSLAPGEFSRSFSIPTLADRTDDGDKTARFGFPPLAVPGALIDTSATTFDMNILDGDPAPRVAIDDVSVVEGDNGSKTVQVPVRLFGSRPAGTPTQIQIPFTVVPGTATRPQDVFTVSGWVSFPGNYDPDVGVTAFATIDINGDLLDEADETFTVVLDPNATFPAGVPLDIVDGSATVTILEDDDRAPRITTVFVDGSGWQQRFRDHLAASGQGDASFGFAIDPAAAPDELPWVNVDRVSVRFDEPVQDLAQAALMLRGLNVPTYAPSGFAYDAATRTATWSFAAPFAVDRLEGVPANVRDAGGNVMTTANGTFRLDVLPGDVNRSGGSVIGSDVTNVRNAQNSPPGGVNSLYTIFKDVNGSGTIVGSDVTAVRNRQGFRLPTETFGSSTATAATLQLLSVRAAELAEEARLTAADPQ